MILKVQEKAAEIVALLPDDLRASLEIQNDKTAAI
jgi:hypothetical protein